MSSQEGSEDDTIGRLRPRLFFLHPSSSIKAKQHYQEKSGGPSHHSWNPRTWSKSSTNHPSFLPRPRKAPTQKHNSPSLKHKSRVHHIATNILALSLRAIKHLNLFNDTDTSFPSRIPVRATPKGPRINGVALPPSYTHGLVVENLATLAGQVCSLLADVLRDQNKLRILLSLEGNAVQRLLDSFQLLLDVDVLTTSSRSILITTLVKLSQKCDLYPQSLDLTTIDREEDPFANDGFFETYKGHLQNRMICLKVVAANGSPSMQSDLVKKYFREAVLWSQLAHPNVLPFYGIHRLDDRRNRVAFVSPWMRNGNVHTFLQQDPDFICQPLLADVAHGMFYLHSNKIIHGDIRAENVLIHDSGRACLAEFGMASFRDAYDQQDSAFLSSGSASGVVIRYQAPELFDPNRNPVKNKATDVYAFAMLCYEMYTGTLPYSDFAPDLALITAVRQGRRPILPSGTLRPLRGFNSSIKKLIQDCWNQCPGRRPSAQRIIECLENDLTTKGGLGSWGLDSSSQVRLTFELDNLNVQTVEEAVQNLKSSLKTKRPKSYQTSATTTL